MKLKSLLMTILLFLIPVSVLALSLAGSPIFQAFDGDGVPLSGGFIYTYEVGSTTKKATYQDKDSVAAHPNPIELDSRGEAEIWWNGAYKLILKDSSDTLIWTVDNFQGTGIYVDSASSAVSGYVAISALSGTSEIRFVATLSGNSITAGTLNITDAELPDPITTPEIRTEANITGKIYIINLTGNPVSIAGGKTGTTITGASCYGGWTKSGTSAQIGNATTEVTAIMTSAVKGMSHVFRILQSTYLSGGTINVLFEAGDNIASQTAIIAGTSKYILSGTTNAKKLVLTASGTSEWEVDEIGSPTVDWD